MFNSPNSASEAGLRQSLRNKSRVKKFLLNTDGNIATLFLFMSTMLFFFVGGAVDYSRWNAVRADMYESMDAASLALARLAQAKPDLTDTELKAYGKRFFYENFSHEDEIEKIAGLDGGLPDDIISFDLSDGAVVEACVEGQLKTYLLRIVGKSYFDIDNCVEITKKGSGRIELALVLDVTGSMTSKIDGTRKIDSLKDAVETMLDVMFDGDATSENLRIGVVPFNAYVNPGGASDWDSDWEDEDAEAYYHGRHFFHTNSEGDVDTGTYAMQANSRGGVARLVDPDIKVSHYKLFDAIGDSWMGCVEARPYPLDELDTPPGESVTVNLTSVNDIPDDLLSIGTDSPYKYRIRQAFSRAPSLTLNASDVALTENSRWVPFFHPDEPDCDNNACNWSSYVNRSYTMSNGVTRSMRIYGYMFDDPDNEGDDEDDYDNREAIDDYRYTNKNSGDNFHQYADVVLAFRYAARNSYTSEHDAYWSDVRDFFADRFNATDYSDHEYRIRNSYVGVWNDITQEYEGKYDLSPSTDGRRRGPNLSCPTEILPITDVRDDVETYVNNLSAYGNTNSANGALWGLRMLSPEAPLTNDIAFDDQNWQKAVVIMTDGVNVAGSEDTHWESGMTSYGYSIEERMGAGVDRPARGGDNFDSDRMADHIDEKLLRVCYRMKEQGILVYTIMFGLDDEDTELVFRACASEPNEPYFQDAADGDDLIDAFGDIAADLVDLHVSK